VDSSSWRLHKIGSSIHPHEVSDGLWLLNMQPTGCIWCNADLGMFC
jgi:hypothetical protein